MERAGRFVQFVDLGRIAANVADRSRLEASSGIGRTEDVVVAHDGYGERSRARNDATDSAPNVVLDDWVEEVDASGVSPLLSRVPRRYPQRTLPRASVVHGKLRQSKALRFDFWRRRRASESRCELVLCAGNRKANVSAPALQLRNGRSRRAARRSRQRAVLGDARHKGRLFDLRHCKRQAVH